MQPTASDLAGVSVSAKHLPREITLKRIVITGHLPERKNQFPEQS